MFGFFKRKKAEAEEEYVPTAEEKELFERGERLLKQLGPIDYLHNIASLMLTNARQMDEMELFGHIHTCIQIQAAAMVGTLAQIAAWKLRENVEDSEQVAQQFEQLAISSTADALQYMREHELPISIQ